MKVNLFKFLLSMISFTMTVSLWSVCNYSIFGSVKKVAKAISAAEKKLDKLVDIIEKVDLGEVLKILAQSRLEKNALKRMEKGVDRNIKPRPDQNQKKVKRTKWWKSRRGRNVRAIKYDDEREEVDINNELWNHPYRYSVPQTYIERSRKLRSAVRSSNYVLRGTTRQNTKD